MEDGPSHSKGITKREKIMNHLRMIAEDVIPVSRARLAAAIVVKGKVKSIGVNQWRTDPLQKRFQRHKDSVHTHAEISAIKNFLKRHNAEELEKATLYVVRRKMSGSNGVMVDGNACPCEGCQRAIAAYKIKNVVYTRG